MSFPNHVDIVARERAKFGATLDAAGCFAVTNAVASDPVVAADGWGLTKAPAGGEGFVVNGQNYRLDKLCHQSGFINDILGSTPGAASPQWGPNPDSNGNASTWAAPVSLGNAAPVPVSTPTQSNTDALQAQLTALTARVLLLEQRPEPASIPDLSLFAKKDDTVTVKGHLPGLMLRATDVVWKGTIDKS